MATKVRAVKKPVKTARKKQSVKAVPESTKFITAVMSFDSFYPSGPYPFIPRVVNGNHPRFKVGTRFDYGFLQVALQGGYKVIIEPASEEAVKQAADTYRAMHRDEDTSWVDWA